jgi:hypothetical protein
MTNLKQFLTEYFDVITYEKQNLQNEASKLLKISIQDKELSNRVDPNKV